MFALLEFVVDYIHFNAETYRRHDFVDNALGCKLAENRSQEYYTNDSLQNGLYKMGVNSFESCFFSYNIASKTLFCLWVKTILLSIAFLFFAISGYNEIAIFIIQLAIPLLLLQQAIKQQLYVVRLKEVLARYRTIFNNIKNVTEYNTAKLLREILEYEGIISWGNLLLDETTYNNLNAELSAQWEEKKKEYSIV
ncbi:hypothetical protein EZS27_021766 [termite gut metagenome]|uniref:Uncharacterized protein n=1 Tax=termite gut metagenome TaxID=433724 RepID=A0A5J4R6Z4_9ZZZZ